MTVSSSATCPYCGSPSVQATHQRFSLFYFLLIGWWAIFFGTKKPIVTCLACGRQWKAGDAQRISRKVASRRLVGRAVKLVLAIVVALLLGILGLMTLLSRGAR